MQVAGKLSGYSMTMEYDFENDRELQLKAYEIYRKYDIASVQEIRGLEGFSNKQLVISN